MNKVDVQTKTLIIKQAIFHKLMHSISIESRDRKNKSLNLELSLGYSIDHNLTMLPYLFYEVNKRSSILESNFIGSN